MNKIPFTKQGYNKLVAEQKKLEDDRLLAVSALKQARELGDLSENAAYKVARSKLSSLDSRLRYLNRTLNNAYIVDTVFKGVVDIGCYVTIENNAVVETYQIVSTHESDILNKKISFYSPIGKALMGKKVAEIVKVRTPLGVNEFRITNIKV